jgi:hypothetical protein
VELGGSDEKFVPTNILQEGRQIWWIGHYLPIVINLIWVQFDLYDQK